MPVEEPIEPRVTNGRVVYAIASVYGRLDRVRAAHEFFRRDVEALRNGPSPPSEAVIVHMGNYIDFRKARESVESIKRLNSFKPKGVHQIFLKGKNEQDLQNVEKLRKLFLETETELTHTPINELTREIRLTDFLERELAERDRLLVEMAKPQRQFIGRLRAEHREGNYLFCTSAEPSIPGTYGISCTGNYYAPTLEDHTLRLNIVSNAVPVLRLQKDQRQLTIIADEDANGGTQLYEEAVTTGNDGPFLSRNPQFRPFRFENAEPLDRRPVWTSSANLNPG